MSLTVLAAIGMAFWEYIKQAGNRFVSLFVVTTELHNQAVPCVSTYLFTNFQQVSVGNREVHGWDMFVRSLGRYTVVGYERVSSFSVFRQGWKFVWLTRSGNQNEADKLILHWFRGVFDFETFFSDAFNVYTKRHIAAAGTPIGFAHPRRFKIHRVTGRNGMSNDHNEVVGDDPDRIDWSPEGVRYLQYDLADIGSVPAVVTLDDIALPEGAEPFCTRVKWWLQSREWYKARGIPWRTSALFKGLPGCGKSSFVRAIACAHDLPIFVFDITTMNNTEFVAAWHRAATRGPCVVLLEDIDRIFDSDKNIKDTRTVGQAMTLDAILNCASGVDDASGIMLVVTANDVSKLDPALLRPGRLDVHIEFTKPSRAGRAKIASRILHGYEDAITATVDAGTEDTGAEFEQRCRDIALARHWSSVTTNPAP